MLENIVNIKNNIMLNRKHEQLNNHSETRQVGRNLGLALLIELNIKERQKALNTYQESRYYMSDRLSTLNQKEYSIYSN